MFSPLRFSGCFAAVVLAMAPGARADGQLAKSSPFMPPAGANPAAPTAGAPLEYRGWIQTAEGVMFRLRDPARKVDTWVKLNEPDRTLDVVAKQHDNERNTLTLEHQGKTLTLAVREAKIVSSGSASHPMPIPVPMAPNVSPAVTQSVVVNPTPADEQRRLDAVAAEVARRRALREQAAQQAAPGANVRPPTFVQPQTPQQLQQRGMPALPQRGYAVPAQKSGAQPR